MTLIRHPSMTPHSHNMITYLSNPILKIHNWMVDTKGNEDLILEVGNLIINGVD